MKKYYYFIIIAVMAFGFYSCEDPDSVVEEKITIDGELSRTISDEGGPIVLKFTASHDWTITETTDWLKLTRTLE